MTAPLAYFFCKHCRERIVFPFPTPQETEECQHRLPTGTWQINFLCPYCDKASHYMAGDVRLMVPLTAGGAAWDKRRGLVRVGGQGQPSFRHIDPSAFSFYRVEHVCGHKDCGLPVVLYVQTTEYLTERTVEQKAKSAVPRPFCPAGHIFHPFYKLASVKEVFSLLQ
jgi:hypothetical protein